MSARTLTTLAVPIIMLIVTANIVWGAEIVYPNQFNHRVPVAEQATWYAVYGESAPEHWANEHNRALVARNGSTCGVDPDVEATFIAVYGLGLGCANWIKEAGGLAPPPAELSFTLRPGRSTTLPAGTVISGDVAVWDGTRWLPLYDDSSDTGLVVYLTTPTKVLAPWGAWVSNREPTAVADMAIAAGCGNGCQMVILKHWGQNRVLETQTFRH